MKAQSLKSNTFFLVAGTFLNKGLQFVMIPLFSRWLSIEDYGRFDLFCTYVMLLVPVLTFACSEAVFRYGVEKENIMEKAVPISNGFALVSGNLILMWGIVFFVSRKYLWKNMVAFLAFVTLETYLNYFQGYMRAVRRLDLYSFCTAFSTFSIAISATIFVRIFKFGLNGMIYGYVLGYLMGILPIVYLTKFWRYLSIKLICVQNIKKLIRYSYSLIPNNLAWWIINVSDRSIIRLILGVSSNGIYAIACKIPNLASAVFGVFSISWQEAASDIVNQKNREETYQRVFTRMCQLLIPLCSGIIASNFVFFDFIFDMRYKQGAFYTPILVTSVIFCSLSQFFGGIQISLKRPKANGVTTFWGAVVNVCTHILFIPIMGLYAAAISTLLSNMFITCIRAYLLKNEISIGINRKFKEMTLCYLYFVIMSYIPLHLEFRIANLVLAGIFFVFENKKENQ